MSFSKAKLKRFNDVASGSPATIKLASSESTPTSAAATTASSSTAASHHPERKEQIEKFFKEAVRFASSSSKESKEFATPKECKEDKKSKGLRLFRTPSLPQRLRFRHNNNSSSNSNNNNNDPAAAATGAASSSTPLHSATTTPIKELASKSVSRLKGKEALQQEIRNKNELIENYLSQLDVLRRHVEQLKESEQKLLTEKSLGALKTEELVHALTTENLQQKEHNEQLTAQQTTLAAQCAQLENDLVALRLQHSVEIADLQQQREAHNKLQQEFVELEQAVGEARQKIKADAALAEENYQLIQNLRNTNATLIADVHQLKRQIEQDALAYAQETKTTHNEMDCLKNERNTLKTDLASKCELIRSLQEELLDKNCEIDAHCDTIRQLCRENAQYAEKERFMSTAEEKVRNAELQAAQKVEKLESDMENALEREKCYWRGELEKRQKMAENELIKIELEKQDVMVMLESTNDMLRERDEKLQKYEDQLRNGIDYYVQLTDALQKQVVDLKQDVAKTITEKYNYQLTLSNTRATVNILMERLKKSDADVEQMKAELESAQLARGALEQSYLTLQADQETLRTKLADAEQALQTLHDSSQTLQHEVSIKENLFNDILTSEEDTLDKLNKIASSFQTRIDADAARYIELYNELRHKDEARELYMQDMKKALDEFATVLQYAQLEMDSKDKALAKMHEECEQLKLENITLKSKIEDDNATKRGNSTDLEKIEDMLIDSELRAECDKITSWLLSADNKNVRCDSNNEMCDLLKSTMCATPTATANKSARTTRSTNNTPVRTSASKVPAVTTTPRTPRTPRTTPKKTVLFPGKENVPSPQKHVLKPRNI